MFCDHFQTETRADETLILTFTLTLLKQEFIRLIRKLFQERNSHIEPWSIYHDRMVRQISIELFQRQLEGVSSQTSDSRASHDAFRSGLNPLGTGTTYMWVE